MWERKTKVKEHREDWEVEKDRKEENYHNNYLALEDFYQKVKIFNDSAFYEAEYVRNDIGRSIEELEVKLKEVGQGG